jgi:8-oxo-dGTP pyrophosphatase MutT (NUDIX family)
MSLMIKIEQIAALPLRARKKGTIEILLVTTRGRGRWTPPKGWPMDGLEPWNAARIEALEEAGAIGVVSTDAFGQYLRTKTLDGGATACLMTVYPLIVTKLKPNWKERKERKRRWFPLEVAAAKVDEPELGQLIRLLDRASIKKDQLILDKTSET